MMSQVTDRRSNEFRLDKSINLGNVLTVIIILFTLAQMYTGIITRMTKMEDKVDVMWSQFIDKIGK